MPAITAYKAIADDTRRHILDLLRAEALTAGVIAERVQTRGPGRGLSRPAVSKHLRILRGSRLVLSRKHGRERLYSLNAGPLQDVEHWVRQYEAFWDRQLDSFKSYVEAEVKKEQAHDQES